MKAGWAYAMQIRMEQGRWVVAALRVFPEAELLDSNRMKYLKSGPITDRAIPPGGLTARQLRQISFQEPLAPYNGLMKAAKKIADQYKITSPQTSDYDLARIAEIYVDVLRRGSRRSNQDRAKRTGLSPSQVRDAIHKARARGLLTPSRGQGFAGGELTPTAADLLKDGHLKAMAAAEAKNPFTRKSGRVTAKRIR
jgi:hypothetical protein